MGLRSWSCVTSTFQRPSWPMCMLCARRCRPPGLSCIVGDLGLEVMKAADLVEAVIVDRHADPVHDRPVQMIVVWEPQVEDPVFCHALAALGGLRPPEEDERAASVVHQLAHFFPDSGGI